ncbi:hypothetical protein SCLCIDRAFT_742121 [Scleroderma citrinum Foug A]|uniref:Uncharacterized protein n=1 Tax=Scleroderma citrinum Foug A TaxID=1036808 RepID=A0A0C3D466_9AGAM|nr:hypothetical protein SCLCIDRAFT_742121 [Scleroderma citrinum Foug A]
MHTWTSLENETLPFGIRTHLCSTVASEFRSQYKPVDGRGCETSAPAFDEERKSIGI